MEAYWKRLVSYSEIEKVEDSHIFIKEWGATKFAKAAVYGKIASTIVHCSTEDLHFNHPNGTVSEVIDMRKMFKFLYAVRKFPVKCNHSNGCIFTIPSRYEEKANSFCMKNLIDMVVSCFRGELPTILARVFIKDDVNIQYIDFLRELHFLNVEYVDWRNRPVWSLYFVQSVLKVAANLEVLTLCGDDQSYYDQDDSESADVIERVPLNKFCCHLTSHPTFWSKFRLLKVS